MKIHTFVPKERKHMDKTEAREQTLTYLWEKLPFIVREKISDAVESGEFETRVRSDELCEEDIKNLYVLGYAVRHVDYLTTISWY